MSEKKSKIPKGTIKRLIGEQVPGLRISGDLVDYFVERILEYIVVKTKEAAKVALYQESQTLRLKHLQTAERVSKGYGIN